MVNESRKYGSGSSSHLLHVVSFYLETHHRLFGGEYFQDLTAMASRPEGKSSSTSTYWK